VTVIAAAMVAAAFAPAPALAQTAPTNPHLGYAYPAGARQGPTVQVLVGGRYLDGAGSVIVSGRGVQGRFISVDKPLNGRQLTDLREKAQELQKKLPDPAVRRELTEIRQKVGDSVRRNANPVLSDIATLELTVDADAEPGPRQLRVGTSIGLSDPVVFCVGQLPEVAETESAEGDAAPPMEVALPVVVNGRLIPGEKERLQGNIRQGVQYLPGDVDRYRFQAKKGQELVAIVSARDLMPYLADAVPGWFQATLTITDAAGREVAYDDDFRFQPDPVVHLTVPADGVYTIAIKDAIFRGREDFVYRVAIGEIPYITGIYPLGGPADSKTTIEVAGWNLPAKSLVMDTKGAVPGVFPVSMHRGQLLTNAVPFDVAALPEVLEREPNNAPKDAQRVTLPAVVNGRILQAGDVDLYTFAGRKGDRVVAEIRARRLRSPLDANLELTDAAGTRVAFNDDVTDQGAGLITHQADPQFIATLPADGTYLLRVADTQHAGGPDFGYRLRLSAPQPDFEVRITPSTINGPGGTSVPITASVVRRDGFAGDVTLALIRAPEGFGLSGGVVPAGVDQIRLTLSMPPVVTREPGVLQIEGHAAIAGKLVVRRATAAEDMMQAFAYRHLVPADDLRVCVIARGAARVPVRLLSAVPVKLTAGGSARVRVALPPGYRTFENLQLELSEPPDGITLGAVEMGQGGAEFVVQADAAKSKAGFRGNLIVTVSGERVPGPNAQAARPGGVPTPPGGQNVAAAQAAPNAPAGQAALPPPAAARRRVTIGTLPAIAVEITPPR
jgi:hypothetical protein